MISLFEVKDKYVIINWFYTQESQEWHKNIHKRSGTEQENIRDTLDTISDGSVMYGVQEGNQLAAFFVKYEDEKGRLALEGFHVAKKFRTSMFLIKFWALVKETFGKEFVTGISHNNEPALNHLRLQGFEIQNGIEVDDHIFYILKLK